MTVKEITEKKSALRRLREERKETIERVRTRVAAVNGAMKKIHAELSLGPRTIPEIAEAVGLSTGETLWYLMALKKYGKVAEGTKARGQSYYPYELIGNAEPEEAAE